MASVGKETKLNTGKRLSDGSYILELHGSYALAMTRRHFITGRLEGDNLTDRKAFNEVEAARADLRNRADFDKIAVLNPQNTASPMNEAIRQKLKEMIGQIQCPVDSYCVKNDLTLLCKTKDIGVENFVQCLDVPRQRCKFFVIFGKGRFCKCPIGVYITRNLKSKGINHTPLK